MSTPISPLVADLILANVDSLAKSTNVVIDGLQRQLDEAEATLGAIRTGMNHLLAERYAPSAQAIEQVVFYPKAALIEACRRKDGES